MWYLNSVWEVKLKTSNSQDLVIGYIVWQFYLIEEQGNITKV